MRKTGPLPRLLIARNILRRRPSKIFHVLIRKVRKDAEINAFLTKHWAHLDMLFEPVSNLLRDGPPMVPSCEDAEESGHCARGARRAGERDDKAQGGRRRLSRRAAGIHTRERVAPV